MQGRRVFIPLLVVATSVGLVAGCGSSSKSSSPTTTTAGATSTVPATSGTTVNLTVGDTNGLDGAMTLAVTPATAPAGDVTFVVKNTGTIDHEVILLKTDVAFDKLPVADAGDPPVPVTTGADKVDEADNVAESGEPNLKPGQTRSFTAKNLVAGQYALVCNIALHYGKGMRAAFTVTG